MKKTNRLKKRRILTVKEFRARFGDDDQCARYLASERWPNRFPVSPLWGSQSRLYGESARGRMRRLWVPVFGDRRNHFSQDPGSPHRLVLGDLSDGPGQERDFRSAGSKILLAQAGVPTGSI